MRTGINPRGQQGRRGNLSTDSALIGQYSCLCFAVGAILLSLCSSAKAEQQKKIPHIGYLTVLAGPSDRDAAFRQGLKDLGYIEGKNIIVEYRYANGTDWLAEMAAELVRLKLDVL